MRLKFEQAEELGEQDGQHVVEMAGAVVLGDCCTVLIDGQHLSPSWRALPNGEYVYDRAGDASNGPEFIEAYTEVLDGIVDGYGTNGESLMWHDGALWLVSEDCECHA